MNRPARIALVATTLAAAAFVMSCSRDAVADANRLVQSAQCEQRAYQEQAEREREIEQHMMPPDNEFRAYVYRNAEQSSEAMLQNALFKCQ